MTSTTEPNMNRFDWRCGEIGSVLHVWFQGELDFHAVRTTSAALRASLAGERRTVVLDMGEVSFMDSSGLELLIRTKRDIEAHNGRLLVSRLSAAAKRVVEISQLNTWFEAADVEPFKLMPCPVCDEPLSPVAQVCDQCGSAL